MRYLPPALLALALLVSTASLYEAHKGRLETAAARERTDVAVAAVRELTALAAPKAQHAICPTKDGHPEVDLGVPGPCPKPDDAPWCVRWRDQVLTSAQVEVRCKAGSL